MVIIQKSWVKKGLVTLHCKQKLSFNNTSMDSDRSYLIKNTFEVFVRILTHTLIDIVGVKPSDHFFVTGHLLDMKNNSNAVFYMT